MARQAKAKTTVDSEVTEAVVENTTASVIEEKTTVVKKEKELMDTDEIEVISLIPNVSYKDNKTGDMYEWENVGDTEFMFFGVLKEMRRGYKSYFNELWLKPLDSRVIKHFGLNKIYDKYEFLMDKAAYTRENITETCEGIIALPNGLKLTMFNKIKNFISNGEISDVNVIRTLERKLNIDLLYML